MGNQDPHLIYLDCGVRRMNNCEILVIHMLNFVQSILSWGHLRLYGMKFKAIFLGTLFLAEA